MATHAGTVAPGWVEIEAGAEFDRFGDRSTGNNIPVVVKAGLAPRIQLSVSGAGVRAPHEDTTGVGDIALGVKWRLSDAAPVLGRFAVLPGLKVPTGSAALNRGTGTTDVSLLVISSHDFGPVALDVGAIVPVTGPQPHAYYVGGVYNIGRLWR